MNKVFWRTRELTAAGVPDKQIAAKVRRGELHKLDRGLYSTEEQTDLVTLRGLAWAHPGLRYSGSTAAFLHAIPGFDSVHWPAQGRIPRDRSNDGGALLDLTTSDTKVGQLVHTVPTLTPLDTATELPETPRDVLREFLVRSYQGAKGNTRLAEHMAAMPPRRRAIAAGLLEDLVTGTASSLEVKAVAVIVGALEGLPVSIEVNALVCGYRFDIVIPEVKVCIEIDSRTYHAARSARPNTFRNDRWKGNAAVLAGWTLLRYPDVSIDRASEFVALQVRDAVLHNLRHPRGRTQRTTLLVTDRTVWDWHPPGV